MGKSAPWKERQRWEWFLRRRSSLLLSSFLFHLSTFSTPLHRHASHLVPFNFAASPIPCLPLLSTEPRHCQRQVEGGRQPVVKSFPPLQFHQIPSFKCLAAKIPALCIVVCLVDISLLQDMSLSWVEGGELGNSLKHLPLLSRWSSSSNSNQSYAEILSQKTTSLIAG